MSCLILISVLVKLPKFHGLYIQNYNDPKPKIITIGTLICILSNLQIHLSEASWKQSYSEKFQHDFFEEEKPWIDTLVPNVVKKIHKISK
jgi:hypothetical protein